MNTNSKNYRKILSLFLTSFIISFCLISTANALSKTAVSSIPTLTTDQVIPELKSLIGYEADGFFLLDKAAENIRNKKIKNWLINFKEERKAHIKTLTDLLLKNTACKDYLPPKLEEFEGFYNKGSYSEFKTSDDEHAVLQWLLENEKPIIEAYEKALKLKFPQKMGIKIKNIYKHNRQHNAYLEHLAKTIS